MTASPATVPQLDDLELAVLTLARTPLRPYDDDVAVDILARARQSGHDLLDELRDRASVEVITAAIASELGLPVVDMDLADSPWRVDDDAVSQVSAQELRHWVALPMVDPHNGQAVLVVPNPVAGGHLTDWADQNYPGRTLVFGFAGQIHSRLVKLASASTGLDFSAPVDRPRTTARTSKTTPLRSTGNNPVLDFIDALLENAVAEGASDIHLDTNADGSILLRLRVDSIMRLVRVPDAIVGSEDQVFAAILTRAGMEPSNRLEPQDGTFGLFTAGRNIDFRVAMIPHYNGPGVVIRILDSAKLNLTITEMGFGADQAQMLLNAIHANQGCIITSGPTGSGKSTTQYAALREINAVERKVLTIEDPVEYRLPMISQTQVQTNRGDRSLTFARALKAALRADPDVILVGECRDAETAKAATEAAITGHLVLSTIHARDALGIVTRLREMGVDPSMIAEALTLAISQRLLRRVHSCARQSAPTPSEVARFEALGLPVPATVARPAGCGACNNSGYKGRIAVAEVFAPDRTVRHLIQTRASAVEIEQAATAAGYRPLAYDALRHIAAGHTTFEEFDRVVAAEAAGMSE